MADGRRTAASHPWHDLYIGKAGFVPTSNDQKQQETCCEKLNQETICLAPGSILWNAWSAFRCKSTLMLGNVETRLIAILLNLAGADAPNIFNAVIEIPRGSKVNQPVLWSQGGILLQHSRLRSLFKIQSRAFQPLLKRQIASRSSTSWTSLPECCTLTEFSTALSYIHTIVSHLDTLRLFKHHFEGQFLTHKPFCRWVHPSDTLWRRWSLGCLGPHAGKISGNP